MRVLSFDVGVRNLSFALLRASPSPADADDDAKTETTLERWGVVDLTEGRGGITPKQAMRDVEGLVKSLLHALHHECRFLTDDRFVDHVIIENQPCIKNPTMKTLQVALATYFQTMQMLSRTPAVGSVRAVSASSKLGAEWKGLSYAERKKRSVELARALLDSVDCADDMRQRFACSPKKDDLADAFLLAVAFSDKEREAEGRHRKAAEKKKKEKAAADLTGPEKSKHHAVKTDRERSACPREENAASVSSTSTNR